MTRYVIFYSCLFNLLDISVCLCLCLGVSACLYLCLALSDCLCVSACLIEKSQHVAPVIVAAVLTRDRAMHDGPLMAVVSALSAEVPSG